MRDPGTPKIGEVEPFTIILQTTEPSAAPSPVLETAGILVLFTAAAPVLRQRRCPDADTLPQTAFLRV